MSIRVRAGIVLWANAFVLIGSPNAVGQANGDPVHKDAHKGIAGKFQLGVIAGIPLTNDLPPPPPDTPRYTGQVRRHVDFRFAAGLMAGMSLTNEASIEVNGLYRRLFFRESPDVIVTWEIPALALYKFPKWRLSPFVEAGPSFRITGNLNNSAPSHYGVTGGAGIEAHPGRCRITPRLRYTRWAADIRTRIAPQQFTKLDQVELLAGFSF